MAFCWLMFYSCQMVCVRALTWLCPCPSNSGRPYSVSRKSTEAPVWFLQRLLVFCLNRKLETVQLGSSGHPLCIAPPSGGPLSSLASRGSWEPMTLVQGLASLQNLCGGLLEGFSLGMWGPFPLETSQSVSVRRGPSGPMKWPLSHSVWKSAALTRGLFMCGQFSSSSTLLECTLGS